MPQKPTFYYGWIIVFLAFMSISTYGLFFSYSVFLEPLEAEFHCSRTAISAAYMIYMIVYGSCAVPMGWFSDKYGPRKPLWLAAFLIGSGICLCSTMTSIWQLYLFFGVIASIGHGAVFVVPISTVNRWFTQRRGLAVGIAACGLGLGLLVVPPVAAQIIITYGWRVAFIILGSTFFVINGIVGTFIKRSPENEGLRPLKEIGGETSAPKSSSLNIKDFTVAETLKTKAFWILYLVCVFCFGAEQMALVHIVAYSGEIGISPTEAALGLSLLGVGTIIGRVGTGALSDRKGRVLILTICCFIEAASIFSLTAITSLPMLYLIMFFLGFGYGGWAALCPAMLGDFFGLKNLGRIMGVWFTGSIPAGVLGPLMGGIVFDSTRSYLWAFLFGGIMCTAAAISAALIKSPQK